MAEINVDQSTPLVPSIAHHNRRRDFRTNFQKKLAVFLIICSAGLERLAFYSLAGNLTFFLTSDNFKWRFPNQMIAVLIFLGMSYMSALFFSWVSDAKLGRATTILVGFSIYIVGYVFFSIISHPEMPHRWCLNNTSSNSYHLFQNQYCAPYIVPMLIVTAIGVGAVQANTAVFGAEQTAKTERNRFFDYYYAAINIGALIAYGAVAYVQLDNYFMGYMISTGFLILSFICFASGWKYYYKLPPHDSVASILPRVIINAIATRYKARKYQRQVDDFNASHRNQQNGYANYGTLARSDSSNDEQPIAFTISNSSSSFLDYAKSENGGDFLERQIEDIKKLRRVVIVFFLLISYWLLYFQVETTFVVQGAHMKLPSQDFKMPVVWLSLANQIIIIVLIFILNTFVYKRLEKSGRSFSLKTRMTIGLATAVLAMIFAGTVEKIRIDKPTDESFNQIIGNATYQATNMSIFFQLPQYISIGVSEVFTSVASLEFAYQVAPASAQSLIMSLRFCSGGISSFTGSAVIYFFSLDTNSSDSKDPSSYHSSNIYYIYFFSLAGLQTVFIGIFLFCDYKYKILDVSNDRNRSRFYGSTSTSSH